MFAHSSICSLYIFDISLESDSSKIEGISPVMSKTHGTLTQDETGVCIFWFFGLDPKGEDFLLQSGTAEAAANGESYPEVLEENVL